MAIFKCKMCGGALEIQDGSSVAVCSFCGTKQTIPKLDNETRINLYDRANHFRRNNDYDKAMSIYEQLLDADKTDAEAYWSILLCKYGVEYVEDPQTHRMMPTINRAQYTSIFADEDYKSAIQYADGYQREVYENEAKELDKIQKGILAISQKEDPFDIFICYKETDSYGRRTQDSVLAQDLYYQLTQEGYKVFFSRITLEDKLGTAYEPYIFAALNTAKIMVVIGTSKENLNSVWVKNEWSRFLALTKKDGSKVLIPAYRDMDPYDLPEEFSHLQAQDMSKLGFMQDLIRGIKKILAKDGKVVVIPQNKIGAIVTSCCAVVLTAVLFMTFLLFIPLSNYNKAEELVKAGNYDDALSIYKELNGFSNSERHIEAINTVSAANDYFSRGKLTDGINAVFSQEGTISVEYDCGDGQISKTNKSSIITSSLSKGNNLKTPYRAGYSFTQWAIRDYSVSYDLETVSAELTIVAGWSECTYSVSYDLNGGKLSNYGSNPTSYKYASDDLVIKNPTKEGYVFIGWSGTGIDGLEKELKIAKGSEGDRHYVANWAAENINVTFNLNGGSMDRTQMQVAYDDVATLRRHGNRMGKCNKKIQ